MKNTRRLWFALLLGVGVSVLLVLLIWRIFFATPGDDRQAQEREEQRKALVAKCQKHIQLLKSVQEYVGLVDKTLGATGELNKRDRFLLVGLIQPLREDVNKKLGLPPPGPIVQRDLTQDDLALLRAGIAAHLERLKGPSQEIRELSTKLFDSTPANENEKNNAVEAMVEELATGHDALNETLARMLKKLQKLEEILEKEQPQKDKPS